MTQSKSLTKEQSTQSLISVLITIVIPACILIFFKEKPFISSVQLVLIALMFPFSYSIFEWVQQKMCQLWFYRPGLRRTEHLCEIHIRSGFHLMGFSDYSMSQAH